MNKMLQIAWTFNIMFIYVPYYAGLLQMLGFPLSQKSYVDFCYKPSALFSFWIALTPYVKLVTVYLLKKKEKCEIKSQSDFAIRTRGLFR